MTAINNLRKILNEEGFTQTKLSSATGISIGTINKVACGKMMPSPRVQSVLLKGLQKLSGKEYKCDVVFPGIK